MKRLMKRLDREPNRVYIRLMIYNWKQNGWPKFEYNPSAVEGDLFTFANLTGQISGCVQGLDKAAQSETIMDMWL